jgi:hypothetical protein
MTGRQDDRKEYDRKKDRQRTLGKYMMINDRGISVLPRIFRYGMIHSG